MLINYIIYYLIHSLNSKKYMLSLFYYQIFFINLKNQNFFKTEVFNEKAFKHPQNENLS